jgi:hypothetical protein
MMEKLLITPFLGFLTCILAYSLSAFEEFSLARMGNVFIYFSLSCSELLLLNFNGEILKHHVSHSYEKTLLQNSKAFSSTEFSSR